MRATLAPVSASEIARLAVVVDLPSPGPALDTTKLRGPPSTFTNCRFVRRLRKDSARGLRGSACTMSGRLLAPGSSAIPPRSGASVTWAMSCNEWMRVSSTLRRTAMPMPMANPTRAPSIRLSGTFGLEAAAGTVAGWIVSIFTRLSASPSGFSRLFTTTSAKFVPTELAIAAARSGSLSATVMSIRTVLRGERRLDLLGELGARLVELEFGR